MQRVFATASTSAHEAETVAARAGPARARVGAGPSAPWSKHMSLFGRWIALAAGFAVLSANLAAARADADAGDDDGEDATLAFAEGRLEGERVRLVAGEVDGKGVLYAEYYTGPSLRYAVPYTRVFTDGEETNVRALRGLALQPKQTVDGFAFTAFAGATPLQCTALLWSDATINCSRGTGWEPPGHPSCAKAFVGHDHRQQCNGIRAAYPSPAIPHDELLGACVASFRWESFRNNCIRYGYDRPPAAFREALAACTAAYQTEHERDFCMYYSLEPGPEEERVKPSAVRACTGKFRDERKTTDCIVRLHIGAPPANPNEPVPPPKGTGLPTDKPTAPVVIAPAGARTARGAHIDVTTGTFRDLALRATGGMVGAEPVLWVDAFETTGALKWSNNIDRVAIGTAVRALREATALSAVKLSGDVLTFRATIGGKARQCRSDAGTTYARCR